MKFKQNGFSLVEVLIILAIVITIVVVGFVVYKKQIQKPTSLVPSNSLGSGFSTNGNTMNYLGKAFVPYGVTIYGLSQTTYQNSVASDINQINAISNYWHGNTVRIQIAPDLYNSQTSSFNADLNKEVIVARDDNLNIIISAQYERTNKIAGPDSSTTQFWKSISQNYANDPYVWFDLFNEPRYNCPGNSLPTSSCWNVWKNGNSNFVGMQALVNSIRSNAPNNLILAEGLAGGKTLDGIDKYLLNGSNIVYSVHPYFGSLNRTQTQWDSNFGTISSKIPVIVGEWGQYETTRGSCVTNAPILVPEFMSYLKSHNIGLIAWTLQPGNMIRGNNLENPTSFDNGVTYQCTKNTNNPNAQGSGTDIRNLFLSVP